MLSYFSKVILTAAVAIVVSFYLQLNTNTAEATLPSDQIHTLAPLVKQVSPAVVNISTHGTVEVQRNPLFNDPFFRKFFGEEPSSRKKRQTQSIGSGVIINAHKGYILTNSHVVAKADEIFITLTDRRKLQAKLVGHDPETDVALLKTEPIDLTAVSMADSDYLEVGDFVIAIGNPFGLGQSVSSGIVSALGRTGLGIESYENFIQTDASINPGNSGGALVDLTGKLVGINTAIIAPGGGNIGIGFAIPINMARQIMNQIIEYGDVQRGRIGVQIQDLTLDLAKEFGIIQGSGAIITQVTPNSPAAKAELQPGDVIISVNSKTVHSGSDLRNMIGLLRVGSKVKLKLIRNETELIVKLKVGEFQQGSLSEDLKAIPKLKGAILETIPNNSNLYGRVKGVYIANVEQGSPAWQAGLRAGDVITSVNRKAVTKPSELINIASKSAGALLLHIIRGNGSLFIIIR